MLKHLAGVTLGPLSHSLENDFQTASHFPAISAIKPILIPMIRLTPQRILTATVSLLAASTLVGCYGSLADLDREAASLIARRQALVLGPHGQIDASVTPADPSLLNHRTIF